jgi:sugar lactone lactonase YvrE
MRASPLCWLLVLAASLTLAGNAGAGKVKVWHHNKPGDHDKAQLKNVVLSDTGILRLSHRLRPLAVLDATHVWAVAEDGAGNLYAGTGDEGKVYKIAPDGKTTVAHAATGSQVLSLVVDARGETVYAGTGPEAQVVRIDRRGAKVLCELRASYVWALAVDPKGGNLYAATGPHGKVYRVTPEGKASVFYDTKQDHVLCLAVGPNGTVYAGTDRTGRVYRIDGKGKGFVLYQAPQSEVRTLILADDALYVGTSGTKRRSPGGASGSAGGATARLVKQSAAAHAAALKEAEKEARGAGEGKASDKAPAKGKEPAKGAPAAAPSTPATGENSVYRIGLDGAVREVMRHKVLVLSLLRDGKRFYVGTGMSGQLFEVDEATRERSEIARLDNGQVLGLLRRKDGAVVVAAGDPGKLYALEDAHVARGTVVSEVLDAKLVSRWGSLRWRARTPGKTAVSVAVRSGNVLEPDETWSAWSDEQGDGDEATIAAPAARFLQYRVTLTTDDPAVTPSLDALTIRYATTNQAPEVTKVEVPDVNAMNLDCAKKLKLKWSATDANEDELRYRLYVKKDGWDRWVQLEEEHERTDYEWDTTTTPSGVYRLRVVASDHVDNPEKEALTGARVSEPFVVCHTPPEVTVKTAGTEGGRVAVEATATSPLLRLTAASYAINGKKWVNVFPADGLFDSKRETFKFRTEALKPGAYVLVLKVTDAAGNTGTADVVFTVPTPRVAKK